MISKKSLLPTVIYCLVFYYSTSGFANEKGNTLPLWELGVATGWLDIPHYVGSDENYSFPLAFPYVIYRGDFLKADREGIRSEFFNTDNMSFDLGFSFGLPVSGDNDARVGMPDLHLSGQVGPRFNWTIAEHNRIRYSFHLPIRYSRDIKNNELGWVSEPMFKIQRKNFGHQNKYSAQAEIGLLYASKKYNQYYYEVAEEFATPDRNKYDASSGISNYFLGIGCSYQLSTQLKLNGFIRWKTTNGSIINDSPLVKDDNYFAIGVGFSWIFKQSNNML